jgi:PiT family inorganic phosphate transporter
LNTGLILVILTCVVALAFDFINGFHDAANSIATVVSTRVLSPKLAVIWAAFFNFLAAFIFGIAVAKTIYSGMIQIDAVTQYVVLAGLLGAIVWDLLTWWWGLPTSSSHALIGAYAGAALCRASLLHGWQNAHRILVPSGWIRTISFIFIAPVLGFVLGFIFMVAIYWIFRHKAPRQIDTWFRKLQLLSAASYSLGHGGNDAQKTMGIIAGALYTGHFMTQYEITHDWGRLHWPIIIGANAAIAAGTYFGGWKIVHTMGSKITKLKPVGGFCAETAGAITLFSTAIMGIPVSTTHTITGAIVGVGTTNRLSAVRWGVATRIVWAWVLTIPAAATVAAAVFALMYYFNPAA